MKKTLKLMAMLLCVVAFASLSSCSKDDDSGSSSQIGNYTLGKYHPSKKISKLTIESHDPQVVSMYPRAHYYEFIWNGNKLKSIKFTDEEGHNATYDYTYSDNGYISSITYKDNANSGIVKEVYYSKNRVKMYLGKYDLSADDDGYGVFWFDDNGQLTKMNYDEVNMVNGNPQGLTLYEREITFDNHPNPFKDIILPESIYSFFINLGLEAAPVSSNNGQYYKVDGYENENANAYPTRFRGANSSSMEIEYIN
jgi:hypothetical protein